MMGTLIKIGIFWAAFAIGWVLASLRKRGRTTQDVLDALRETREAIGAPGSEIDELREMLFRITRFRTIDDDGGVTIRIPLTWFNEARDLLARLEGDK